MRLAYTLLSTASFSDTILLSKSSIFGSFSTFFHFLIVNYVLYKTENSILDKQFQLIEKVKDGKIFGYETFPKDKLGNSSRIYQLVNLEGKEYKCTKVASPKRGL